MADKNKLESLAQQALSLAHKYGAEAAQASLGETRIMEADFRDNELENAKAATKLDLGLRLYVQGRFAEHSTSDVNAAALDNFVRQAVALTLLLEPDPDRGLADPARLARGTGPDMKLFDQKLAQSEAAMWIDLARNQEKVMADLGAAQGNMISSTGGAEMEVSYYILATSQGFMAAQEETAWFLVTGLTLLDREEKRRSGYWWQGARLGEQIGAQQMQALSQEAARRALRQMGAKPGPTGAFPVVLENQAAGRLVGDLLGVLNGPALRQKRSYLSDSLGKNIAASCLTIVDRPFLSGGFGSRWFDGEGVAVQDMTVIQNGILQNYYIDTYHSKVLKLPPTTAAASNLELAPNAGGGVEYLCQGLKQGLLITGFLGGNFNSTTGDFSYGLTGQWIEDGQIVHAVEGMNMAGNFSQLWASLSQVGDDPYLYSRLRCPSLGFEAVQLSGEG